MSILKVIAACILLAAAVLNGAVFGLGQPEEELLASQSTGPAR